jgi:DNA polymerase elongation subunit (family B)
MARALALGDVMSDANAEPTRFRRWVVLDIETVSTDPTLAKGALDPISGKIACVCLLIDDGATVNEIAIASENEAEILTRFWGALQSSDVLIGHNLYEFDIPFIRARSWIMEIRPSRFIDMRKYYSVDLRDTMAIWTNWGFKKGVMGDNRTSRPATIRIPAPQGENNDN